MLFEITAARETISGEEWFSAFQDGEILPFNSTYEAEQFIREQCECCGTIHDPNYDCYGPIAVRIDL